MDELTCDVEQKQKIRKVFLGLMLVGAICGLLIFIFTFLETLPAYSDGEEIVLEIETGMSVKAIADLAKAEGVVRSDLLLYVALIHFHDPSRIHAGRYVFSEPMNVFEVADKLARNEVDEDLVRLTIPEGVRLAQIAEIASSSLSEFDAEEYLDQTNELEGYLFPETYFVPETFTAKDLIALQQKTYEESVLPLREKIETSNLNEYEILILASILEREANDVDSMRMVSGILQNRLEIGMALQADATIEYVLDTALNELPEGALATELRETKSPYNTYLHPGLPPTPIGNPGLQAIEAAIEPTESSFFYYLTDDEGVFHYAKTFNEHKANISKYLR